MFRVTDILDRLFRILLIFFMVEITAVISIAVFSRYFMNSPVYWAEEVTRYSFVWATFLGAACAYRRKELVSMTVIVNALPAASQRYIFLVLEGIITVFLVLAVVFGIRMAMVVSPQLAVSTRISMAWLYAVVPLSAVFMLLCSLENMRDLFLNRAGREAR